MANAVIRDLSKVVGVMPESSAYTFLEPDAARTYPAFDIKFEVIPKPYKRKETQSDFGHPDDVQGATGAKISFGICLQGHTSGAGNAPYYADALLACGMKETISAGTSVTYNPAMIDDASSGAGYRYGSKSYTVAAWVGSESGKQIRKSIKGARGTFKLVCRAGDPIEILFEFQGSYYSVADDAPPTPSYTALVPPRFVGAGLTLHGGSWAPVFQTLEFDYGNRLGDVLDANDSSGFKGCDVASREMSGSLDPDMDLVANHDFYGRWVAGSAGVIDTGVIGGTAGNKVELQFARTQYSEVGEGEREGRHTAPLKFMPKVGTAGVSVTTEAGLFSLIFT